MTVSDVRATVKKAELLGARVIIPRVTLRQGEEIAVLHDPQGMPFGVWKAK